MTAAPISARKLRSPVHRLHTAGPAPVFISPMPFWQGVVNCLLTLQRSLSQLSLAEPDRSLSTNWQRFVHPVVAPAALWITLTSGGRVLQFHSRQAGDNSSAALCSNRALIPGISRLPGTKTALWQQHPHLGHSELSVLWRWFSNKICAFAAAGHKEQSNLISHLLLISTKEKEIKYK